MGFAAVLLTGGQDTGLLIWSVLGTADRWGVVVVSGLAALIVWLGIPFPRRGWQLIPLSFAMVPLFVRFRDATHLLGDGRLWISVLTGQDRAFHAHEPLAFALFDWAVPAADAAGVTARAEWVSIILGGVAVFLFGFIAQRMARSHRGRWLVFLLLLASGTTQFGFGYIEAYPVLWVALLAYLATGLVAVRGGTLLAPSLALGMAVAVHGTAVLLGSSWLVLARGGSRREVLMGLGLGAIPVIVAYLVVPRMLGGSSGGETVEGTRQILEQFRLYPHGLGAWLAEQTSRWALAAPLAVTVLLLVVGRRFTDLPTDPLVRRGLAFTGALAVGLMLFPLLVDTNGSRGWLVDWDNFSTAGPALMACVGLVGAAQLESGRMARFTATWVVFAALLGTVSFVLLNSRADLAEGRFRRVVGSQSFHASAAMGHESLGMYHRDRGDWERAAADFAVSASFDSTNPRRIRNAAAALMRTGDAQTAATLYGELSRLEPSNPEAWFRLGTALEATEEPDSAGVAYRRALDLAPTHAGALDGLGGLLVRTGSTEADRLEAVVILRRLLVVRPDHPQAGAIRRTIEALGTHEERRPPKGAP